MKFNVVFLIIALGSLLILNNCTGQKNYEINIVMHLKPKFKIEGYPNLYLTNFAVIKNYQVDKDVPIDPNQEIVIRLKNEYSNLSDLNVKIIDINFESTNKIFDDLINDKDYWQNLNIDEKEKSLIYTGKIEFENKDASGFFPKEVTNPRTGVTRTVDVREQKIEVSLGVQLFILSAQTGEILYKETFKETATFSDTTDVTLPMFYTLYDRFAPKMFNTIIPYRIRGMRFLINP